MKSRSVASGRVLYPTAQSWHFWEWMGDNPDCAQIPILKRRKVVKSPLISPSSTTQQLFDIPVRFLLIEKPTQAGVRVGFLRFKKEVS